MTPEGERIAMRRIEAQAAARKNKAAPTYTYFWSGTRWRRSPCFGAPGRDETVSGVITTDFPITDDESYAKLVRLIRDKIGALDLIALNLVGTEV
jgi:hypothetical protein